MVCRRFVSYASAMPFFIFRRPLGKKEVEKQSRRVFLKQTAWLQGAAIAIDRNFFAIMKRIFLKPRQDRSDI
jgi:hypothetical protein